MSRILRFFVCLGTLFFAGNALAAGYSCSSLPTYLSCQVGYYMTSSQSSTTYNGTPKVGNYCQPCSRKGSNYTCAGGTAAPVESAGGYTCPTYKKYTSCSPGYYMTDSSTSTVPDGSSKPGNACRPCSVYGANYTCAGGTAAPQAITINVTCPKGQYLPQGKTACEICIPGNYCPGGTFNNISLVTGATSIYGLSSCPSAYSNSASGSSSINDCYLTLSAGQWVERPGRGAESCSAGAYCDYNGQKIYYSTSDCLTPLESQFPTCTPQEACVQGSYSVAGASACTACQNGTTTFGTGSTSCDATCTGAEGTATWANATWNSDNTVSNQCKATSCDEYYTLHERGFCTGKTYKITYIVVNNTPVDPNNLPGDASVVSGQFEYNYNSRSDGERLPHYGDLIGAAALDELERKGLSYNDGYAWCMSDNWDTLRGCSSNPITNIPAGTSGNITLYAILNPHVYQAALNLGGGGLGFGNTTPSSGVVAIQELYGMTWVDQKTNTEIASVEIPFNYGVFDGYYTAQTGGDQIIPATGVLPVPTTLNVDNTTDDSVMLYAQYTEPTCRVEHGRGDMTNGCSFVRPLHTDAATFDNMLRVIVECDTGYSGADGDEYLVIDATTVGQTVFTGACLARTATVSFNANSGTGGQTATVTATYDAAMPALSSTTAPTRAGYTFMGWYDNADYTKGTQYYTAAGASARTWNKTANTTLYAGWSADTYTITYNLNGGTNAAANPATYNIETATITLANPTKNGYTFGGWYTESAFTNQVTQIAKGSTGNKTFYAKWTATPYTITYNLNGGTNASGAPTSYTIETATITLGTPTRAHSAFGGWYTEPTFKTQVTQIVTGSTGAKAFWAKWTCHAGYSENTSKTACVANTYQITFNANGGTGGQSANVTATYDSAMPSISTTAPTRTGYTFMGWYDNATYTSGTQYYTAAGASARAWNKVANTTLYAGWKINSYTCAAGQYLKAGATSCSSCEAGYACAGGSYSFNTSSIQGRTECSGRTQFSAAGAAKCSTVSTGYYTTGCTNDKLCTGQSQCTSGTWCESGVQKQCSSLTGVSVSGGTYTSAAGSSANTACKYTAPNKTITGCKTVTTNTVTYSGTAWPATTYGVTANGGYIISGNNTAAATCTQCTGAQWSAGETATSCSACPAQTSGWTRNSGTGWTAVTQCNQTKEVGGDCSAGVLKQNATSTTAWGASTISTPLQANPGSIVNGQRCVQCSGAKYSAGGTATSCTPCPAAESGWKAGVGGGWNEVTQCYESKDVVGCSYGQLKKNATSSTTWGTITISIPLQANPGGIVDGQSCKQCSAGTFSAGGTATSCTPCPTADDKWTATSPAGSTTYAACYEYQTPVNCASGSVKRAASSATAYSSTISLLSTLKSNAGYYASTTATSCTICPAGSSCAASATAPTACANWTYAASTGMSSCTACPALTSGWTKADSTGTGWTSHTNCVQISPKPANCAGGNLKQVAASNGATTWGASTVNSALSSEPGYYINGTACSACTGATYYGGGTATSCTPCPSIYTSNTTAAKSKAEQCAVQTTAGKYIATANDSTQTTCPAKNYCPSASVAYGSVNSPTACPAANSTTERTTYPTDYLNVTERGYFGLQSWPSGLKAITDCMTSYSFVNEAGRFIVENVGYNTTTGKYDVDGIRYYTMLNPGWYLKDRLSSEYCNTTSNPMYYSNVVQCPEDHYCPGYTTMPLCSSGEYTTEKGKNACSSLGTGVYTKSPVKSGAETACYLTTTAGKYVAASKAAESACKADGWCPGGIRVNYGSTGGRNTCPTKYPSSAASSNSELDCYVTTAAGKYVATVGAGQVNCAGTGYYCPGGTNVYSGAYGSRLTTGGRTQCPAGYRDLVATASTTKEAQCTMNVAGGKYVKVAKESAASGTCAAGYAKAAHSVTYGNTSSCAACTGTTYAENTGQASCTACPTQSGVTNISYWISTGTHTDANGCYGFYNDVALNNGRAARIQCFWDKTKSQYDTSCGAMKDGLKCNAAYYNAALESSPTNNAAYYTDKASVIAKACTSVGKGYWSPADVYTRTQCPAGYRDGTAGVSEAQCTMNVAGGKYVKVAKESAASGTCVAGYAKAAHSVTYGNTSSCAACTGATYAASTGQATCTTCPTAKTYASAVKSYGYWNNGKDGDHTISDGCYATMTGALSNGSLTEHGCYLGTDGDYGNGGGKRCYVHQDNLKCNAGYYASTLSNGYVWNNTRAGLLGNTCVGVGAGYYSAANILTRNQCPTGLTTIGYGAGADEVTDCGRILHFGNDKLYLRSGKKTTPSLNVKIGDTTYYGNMTAGTGKGKLRLKSGTTTYSVHDDSM